MYKLTWLGHATVLIQTSQGTNILIDPFITGNPKYPKGFELPEKIDLMILTHGHADHIADAIPIAKKYKPEILGPLELLLWLKSKQVEKIQPMNYGGSFRFKEITASMVEARHSSGIEDDGKIVYGGNPGGFVLAIDGAPTVYHAGDTSAFSDMALITELFAPELALLPIGGHYTMDPTGAALAVKFLGVKRVLPIHWGTMPALAGTPEQLEAALAKRGLSDVQVIKVKPGAAIS